MKLIQAIRTIEERERSERKTFVYVQSVLLQQDAVTLKEKTGESNIKEAISKAVYHYLKCPKTDEDTNSGR